MSTEQSGVLIEIKHQEGDDGKIGDVLELRQRRREWFIEQHGVKLGFMSFFVRAVVVC